MREMKMKIYLVIALWAMLFTAGHAAAAEMGSGGTFTLMIYMIGSDLESKGGAGTKDMAEMLESQADLSKLNVLIYTGGSQGWHNEVSAEQHSLYRMGEEGFELLESYDQRSMGDAEPLEQFLTYSYENFTADSYGLILWDHGSGPVIGYGKDTLFDNDSLTLPEMRTALEASPFGADNKLNFIGFDACLMASAELACTAADYSEYLISSQETEPGDGWDYHFVSHCAETDTLTLAEEILQLYMDGCEEYFGGNMLFEKVGGAFS